MNKYNLKEIESFLDNEEIKKRVFGTKSIILNPNYGNPDDTVYNKEFIQELKEQFIEGLTDRNVVQPVITKAYKPRSSTLKKLETINQETIYAIRRHIQTISPFPIHQNTTDHVNEDLKGRPGDVEEILKSIIPFNNEQMCRMESEVKDMVIETILSTIRNIVKNERDSFFIKGFAFEEDFEENKLKYLIEDGQAPFVLSNTDYNFLENLYIDTIRKAINNLFDAAYRFEEGPAMFYGINEDELKSFTLECAKKFSFLNRKVIAELASYFATCGLYDVEFKEDIIKEHDLIRTTHSVLIENLKIQKEKFDFRSWIMNFKEVTAIKPEFLHGLVKDNGFHFIMEDLVSFIKAGIGYNEKEALTLPLGFVEDINNEYKKEHVIRTFYARLNNMFKYMTR